MSNIRPAKECSITITVSGKPWICQVWYRYPTMTPLWACVDREYEITPQTSQRFLLVEYRNEILPGFTDLHQRCWDRRPHRTGRFWRLLASGFIPPSTYGKGGNIFHLWGMEGGNWKNGQHFRERGTSVTIGNICLESCHQIGSTVVCTAPRNMAGLRRLSGMLCGQTLLYRVLAVLKEKPVTIISITRGRKETLIGEETCPHKLARQPRGYFFYQLHSGPREHSPQTNIQQYRRSFAYTAQNPNYVQGKH